MNRKIYTLLFFVGALCPTSSSGSPSSTLILGGYVLSLVLLFVCALRVGLDKKTLIFISGPILVVLMVATVVGFIFQVPFAEAHWGNLLNFACIAFVYCIPFERMEVKRPERVLKIVSTFNIAVGIGLVFAQPVITDFIERYYSSISPEMVPIMLASGKPIVTYAAHSIAALFFYLFFYVNFRAFRSTRQRLYLVFSVGHVTLCAALMSHTSIVFTATALLELLWFAARKHPKLTFVTIAVVVYAAVSLSPISMQEVGEMGSVWWEGSGGSGFLGRYSSQGYGSQLSQIEYISNNPAVPIGIIDSPTINLFSIDSGPIDYILRGSIPLLALMYGGLLVFLRKRLTNRSDVYHLFVAIVAAEIGIEITTYHRSLCLIPAFVLLLRNLEVHSRASTSSKKDLFSEQPLIESPVLTA